MLSYELRQLYNTCLQLQKEVESSNKAKETMVMRYANSEKEILRQRKELDNADKQIKNLMKEVENLNKKTKMLSSERERLIHMVDAKVRRHLIIRPANHDLP